MNRDEFYIALDENKNYLTHHGVIGMHWGVRRYQPYPPGHSGDGKYVGTKRNGGNGNHDKLKKAAKIAGGVAIGALAVKTGAARGAINVARAGGHITKNNAKIAKLSVGKNRGSLSAYDKINDLKEDNKFTKKYMTQYDRYSNFEKERKTQIKINSEIAKEHRDNRRKAYKQLDIISEKYGNDYNKIAENKEDLKRYEKLTKDFLESNRIEAEFLGFNRHLERDSVYYLDKLPKR